MPNQATVFDPTFYNIFAPQKLSLWWWEMESWQTKKWGIGEKRLRTLGIDYPSEQNNGSRLKTKQSLDTKINYVMITDEKFANFYISNGIEMGASHDKLINK